MDDKEEAEKTCSMSQTDEAGNPNLCCCYVMDEDGNIQDPCYHPADECC